MVSLTLLNGSAFKVSKQNVIRFYDAPSGSGSVVEYNAEGVGNPIIAQVSEAAADIQTAEASWFLELTLAAGTIYLNPLKVVSVEANGGGSKVVFGTDQFGISYYTASESVSAVAAVISSAPLGYKVYTALLTQSGDGTSTQTSGTLDIGKRYEITTYEAGDDFSNVAEVVSGTINTTGCQFIATGTTPTDYSNGSTLTDTSAPVATVLENTIGEDLIWERTGVGLYDLSSSSLFTSQKTVLFVGTGEFVNPLDNQFCSINYLTSSSVRVVTGLIYDTGADSLLSNAPIEIRVYN